MQHISAHVSMFGYAAFAASELESVHLLLSQSVPVVGKDVFYNCFRLKERLVIFGKLEDTFSDWFDGWFWNCFSLKTICMPNIRFSSGQVGSEDDPFSYRTVSKINSTDRWASVFTNCFSLEELDLRCYPYSYCYALPCNILKFNHKEALGRNFRSSYYASFESGISREAIVDGCSKEINGFIRRSCEKVKEEKLYEICTCESKPQGPLCDIKTVIYDPKPPDNLIVTIINDTRKPFLFPNKPLTCIQMVAAKPFSWY